MYRAIVVDDVDAIRCSIAGQVDDLPSTVKVAGTAENGEKGLEWLANNYADICITDIRMPVIDGLELIKKIRERYPWMASLIISSYDDFSYAKISIQLEAVDYILKPVDEENLEAALKKSVERIEKDRLSKATSQMFSHMSECNSIIEKWIDYLLAPAKDARCIIDETVRQFCAIAEGNYFLLSFLADELVTRVSGKLALVKPGLSISNDSHEEKTIKNSNVKAWFIHECTVKLKLAMDVLRRSFDESKRSQQSRMIELIFKYINESYARSSFTLQELADHLMFSKNHIANVFKQETGITIWNHIVDLRMKKAKKLLAETAAKTIDIAMDVGYNNYNHFSQLFKEYCGVSAQEYRKLVQGK